MARWAAWRQLTPAALYGISLGLGLVAALWFAELAVHAKLLAIAALAGSFLFARTGSLLAATSREGRIRPVTGWLGTASGLLTELAIYAALAVSAGVGPADRPGRDVRRRAAGHVGGHLGRRRDGRACGGWPSPPCCSWASASWPCSATSTPPARRVTCSPGPRCAPWSRPSPSRPASGTR